MVTHPCGSRNRNLRHASIRFDGTPPTLTAVREDTEPPPLCFRASARGCSRGCARGGGRQSSRERCGARVGCHIGRDGSVGRPGGRELSRRRSRSLARAPRGAAGFRPVPRRLMQGRRARRSAESWWARRSAAGSERRRQVRVPPRAEAATAATDARSDDIHYFADFPLRPSGQCRHSSINRLSTSTRTPLCSPSLSRALSRVRERKRESERQSQSPPRAHRARPAHALTPHAALMAVARSHRDLHLRRPAAEWRWHRRRSCRGSDRRWRLCACRADT